MDDNTLDRTLAKAGDDPVLMVSPEALASIRNATNPLEWQVGRNRQTYRGALIEVHDEWSWGWLVRDRDGQFVHLTEAKHGEA